MQIPIAFEFQSNQTFTSYFPGNNAEIINQLHTFAEKEQEQQIYLWGDSGSGKSHLLHACCQLAKSLGKDPFYLCFNQDNLPSPAILEGLENMEIVALDNLQHIAENAVWQLSLFNFYNNHRQNNGRLLLTADCPPKFLPFSLLDLKTRMGWGLTLKIQSLRDDQLIEALTYKAHDLGFDIPPGVGKFLLNHYVHDLSALWVLLEKIDRATLVAKRKLTIPFLKQILEEQA
ncbi:DnaA regulatory inactivator Hda [Methylomonas sp. AM2-LC]|uniref:DnaA regulatory inactivator Hda n=1 Tax=Methylomonas sp. AM2-LC TaxID=3153301 RepID=UPI0032631B89